ncbi:hypothetical protein ABBQ38_013119 [Trebouxia sp. C0009 RCD-2024]
MQISRAGLHSRASADPPLLEGFTGGIPCRHVLTSKASGAVMHTHRQYAANIHHAQHRFCQQQRSAMLRARLRLARSGVQNRSCSACSNVEAVAPDCMEAAQQVRYQGVYKKSHERYTSQITLEGKQWYLGVYSSPEEPARIFDEARIFTKRDPVNFPKSQYDEAAILQIPDIDTFVKQQRARGIVKSKSCRYAGVVMRSGNRYDASIVVQRKHYYLGGYATPEEAGRVYDEACISLAPDFDTFLKQQKALGRVRTKASRCVTIVHHIKFRTCIIASLSPRLAPGRHHASVYQCFRHQQQCSQEYSSVYQSVSDVLPFHAGQCVVVDLQICQYTVWTSS